MHDESRPEVFGLNDRKRRAVETLYHAFSQHALICSMKRAQAMPATRSRAVGPPLKTWHSPLIRNQLARRGERFERHRPRDPATQLGGIARANAFQRSV